MLDLFWLSDARVASRKPLFPKPHGKPRIDDRRVLSRVILISRNGSHRRDEPSQYGRRKTLCNRWKRWSERGILAKMMAGLAAEHGGKRSVIIDATGLKAHRAASSMAAKKGGGRVRLIGRTQGGINTELHAILDSQDAGHAWQAPP